jgi:hypothetical protein
MALLKQSALTKALDAAESDERNTMNHPVRLSSDWEELCTSRLGVAPLTRRAFQGENLRPLWHALMEKATDDKAGSGMAMDLSVIAQLLGDKATGLAIQNDTLAFQRLYRSPCAAARPALRVLAFAAATDIGGNTPLDFLLDGGDIELITFYVVPGQTLPDPMPEHDVAIVIAPDSLDILAALETLAPAWPRPILNLPAHLRALDRDRLCRLLSGIAGLDIPKTARLDRDQVQALADGTVPLKQVLDDGSYPLIIRPTGSHAGVGLEKIKQPEALADYLDQHDEDEFFIARFVNYANAQGLFHKYRLVVVDGKAYACHMAIAEEWKVWYLNADMAASVPNRLQEALFIQNFDLEFAARHAHALREMITRLGLDYFTVDCAQSPSGELLIFEADHTAIVHDMDPPSVYPYKAPQMRKIFAAVQAMFHRRAGLARASAA